MKVVGITYRNWDIDVYEEDTDYELKIYKDDQLEEKHSYDNLPEALDNWHRETEQMLRVLDKEKNATS